MSVSFDRVPPVWTQTRFNNFLNDIETWINSGSAPANFVYHYTYLIKKNGSDLEAYNSQGVLVYGGANDAGGVDGADFVAVINQCLTDIATPRIGTVIIADALTELNDTIIFPVIGGLGNSYTNFYFYSLSWASTFDDDAFKISGTGGYPTLFGEVVGDAIIINKQNYAHKAVQLSNVNFGRVTINHIQNQGFIDDDDSVRHANAVGLELFSDGNDGTDCSINTIKVKNIRGFTTGVMIKAVNSGEVADNDICDIHVLYAFYAFDMYTDGSTIDLNTYLNCIADGTHWDFEPMIYGFRCGYTTIGGSFTKYINCRVHDAAGVPWYTAATYGNTYRPRLIGCHTSVGFPAVGDFGIESCSGGLASTVTAAYSYAKTVTPQLATWSQAVTGTGSVDQLPLLIGVSTHNTANSTARQYIAAYGFASQGSIFYVDYRKNLKISFTIQRLNSDSEVVAYFQFKQASTHGDLATQGLGVKFVNNHLYGEAYGSARQTADLTIDDNGQHDVQIILNPGVSVQFIVDGTSRGVLTDTAVPTGYDTHQHYLLLSIANGATGGVNASCYVSNVQISQGY